MYENTEIMCLCICYSETGMFTHQKIAFISKSLNIYSEKQCSVFMFRDVVNQFECRLYDVVPLCCTANKNRLRSLAG